MRVLFHGWSYHPHGAGVGRYTYNMARALSGAGHDVVVVTGRHPGYPELTQDQGVTVHRIYEAHELRSDRVASGVLDIARRHACDFIEGADHLGECAPLLARRDRLPVLVKVHSNNALDVLRRSQIVRPWQRLTVGLGLLRAWRQVRAERQSMERADLLLAPSQRVLVEMRKQGLQIPAHHGVVPNPVDIPPEWTNHEAEQPTILFVGRLDLGKGIACLPDLLRRVLRAVPGAVLEIAGADAYARGLGMLGSWLRARFGTDAKQVRFLGPLDDAGLDACYRRAWAVVIPSSWDSLSMVMLEAMARSKALVSSPHGGMPEILAGTGCPVADPATADFAGQVAGLLEDRPLRDRLGATLRARVASVCAPDVVAAQYETFVKAHSHG